MAETKHYRPLPDELYIGMSEIEGNGLFAKQFIKEGTEFGISHIKDGSGNFHSNFIRTPLGGFVNHSDEPNCSFYECGDYLKMKTTKDILLNEELTVTYSLYDPCKDYLNH